MAADNTYPLGGQGVYIKQGSTEMVVGSTGVVNVLGSIVINSSGDLNIDSGGKITLDDGGQIAGPVTVQATTSGTITNYGITTIGTTIASLYTLAAPNRAGLEKSIYCTVHGATTVSQIVRTDSTSTTIVGTSNPASVCIRTLTFTNGGQSITLESLSTSAWGVKANVNAVAITS